MVVKSHYKKIIKEKGPQHVSAAIMAYNCTRPVQILEMLATTMLYLVLAGLWYNDDEVVADAVIVETNPKEKCHGVPIGFGAYKVTVTVSHVDDALLFKPSNVLKTVFDALGTYTTWAKDLILPAI
ncbi:hypothetical protein MKW94_024669 [Papaver nudicaule]|uniref:DUF8039 domain-containing protein n=1 Tax=Papaver nudicaule TaxID=74823 RepID=A0AA41S8V0_PAPNU|nr:hypothetical protein [Papaver nudicaule]